jgi:hypothetical protein
VRLETFFPGSRKNEELRVITHNMTNTGEGTGAVNLFLPQRYFLTMYGNLFFRKL